MSDQRTLISRAFQAFMAEAPAAGIRVTQVLPTAIDAFDEVE